MDWFDTLHYWYNSLLADPDALRWSFVIGLALLALIVFYLLTNLYPTLADPLKGRIDAVTQDPQTVGTQPGRDRAQRLLERMGRGLVPKDADKHQRLATQLIHAGYRRPNAVGVFLGTKVLGVLGLPLLAMLVVLVRGNLSLPLAMLLISFSLALGLLGPELWLKHRIRSRQRALRLALPDALDLLVVCTEAGLGLNAAIQRVAAEIEIQYSQLAEEFNQSMLQMNVGMDARTALQQMVERTGLEEIRSLVSTLLQAMRFGTSITATLRSYAAEMRDIRLKKAEEEAAKVAVKMLIPIALCMLPAIMVISIGPIAMQVMKAFE